MAERGLHAALDEVGRVRRRLAEPPLRVGAGHVEIAQRHIAEVMGAGGVLEHPFDHELRAAVGRDRRERRLLRHRLGRGLAVDRGGRGEDESLHPALDGRLDQRARVRGIVEVVAERIGDRFRHHDLRREMRDRVDPMLLDQRGDEIRVADVADDEPRRVRHSPVEPGRQIVEHDHALARIEETQRHVAADIARASGHQYGHKRPTFFVQG